MQRLGLDADRTVETCPAGLKSGWHLRARLGLPSLNCLLLDERPTTSILPAIDGWKAAPGLQVGALLVH